MKISSLEFLHLELPFRDAFTHARKSRKTGDTVLVRLETTEGAISHGEILPRSYVTGETVNSVMGYGEEPCQAAALSQLLLGETFSDQYALMCWIDRWLPVFDKQTALFGGVELALWGACSQIHGIDLDVLLGEKRHRPVGRCTTIGFNIATGDLRKAAINVRLNGSTVLKIKIGLPDDIERIQAVNQHLKGTIPIRVDANGDYDADRARLLLQECSTTALVSFEQPFRTIDADTLRVQQELYERFGIGFVADESLCSLEDAGQLVNSRGFQIFNLRVGKHGGLQATRRIRDLAINNQIGLVCGSMVGESGVLTQASELLLSRSNQLDYVEGLGQNRDFLLLDPVERVEGSQPMKGFRFKGEECRPHTLHTIVFN